MHPVLGFHVAEGKQRNETFEYVQSFGLAENELKQIFVQPKTVSHDSFQFRYVRTPQQLWLWVDSISFDRDNFLKQKEDSYTPVYTGLVDDFEMNNINRATMLDETEQVEQHRKEVEEKSHTRIVWELKYILEMFTKLYETERGEHKEPTNLQTLVNKLVTGKPNVDALYPRDVDQRFHRAFLAFDSLFASVQEVYIVWTLNPQECIRDLGREPFRFEKMNQTLRYGKQRLDMYQALPQTRYDSKQQMLPKLLQPGFRGIEHPFHPQTAANKLLGWIGAALAWVPKYKQEQTLTPKDQLTVFLFGMKPKIPELLPEDWTFWDSEQHLNYLGLWFPTARNNEFEFLAFRDKPEANAPNTHFLQIGQPCPDFSTRQGSFLIYWVVPRTTFRPRAHPSFQYMVRRSGPLAKMKTVPHSTCTLVRFAAAVDVLFCGKAPENLEGTFQTAVETPLKMFLFPPTFPQQDIPRYLKKVRLCAILEEMFQTQAQQRLDNDVVMVVQSTIPWELGEDFLPSMERIINMNPSVEGDEDYVDLQTYVHFEHLEPISERNQKVLNVERHYKLHHKRQTTSLSWEELLAFVDQRHQSAQRQLRGQSLDSFNAFCLKFKQMALYCVEKSFALADGIWEYLLQYLFKGCKALVQFLFRGSQYIFRKLSIQSIGALLCKKLFILAVGFLFPAAVVPASVAILVIPEIMKATATCFEEVKNIWFCASTIDQKEEKELVHPLQTQFLEKMNFGNVRSQRMLKNHAENFCRVEQTKEGTALWTYDFAHESQYADLFLYPQVMYYSAENGLLEESKLRTVEENWKLSQNFTALEDWKRYGAACAHSSSCVPLLLLKQFVTIHPQLAKYHFVLRAQRETCIALLQTLFTMATDSEMQSFFKTANAQLDVWFLDPQMHFKTVADSSIWNEVQKLWGDRLRLRIVIKEQIVHWSSPSSHLYDIVPDYFKSPPVQQPYPVTSLIFISPQNRYYEYLVRPNPLEVKPNSYLYTLPSDLVKIFHDQARGESVLRKLIPAEAKLAQIEKEKKEKEKKESRVWKTVRSIFWAVMKSTIACVGPFLELGSDIVVLFVMFMISEGSFGNANTASGQALFAAQKKLAVLHATKSDLRQLKAFPSGTAKINNITLYQKFASWKDTLLSIVPEMCQTYPGITMVVLGMVASVLAWKYGDFGWLKDWCIGYMKSMSETQEQQSPYSPEEEKALVQHLPHFQEPSQSSKNALDYRVTWCEQSKSSSSLVIRIAETNRIMSDVITSIDNLLSGCKLKDFRSGGGESDEKLTCNVLKKYKISLSRAMEQLVLDEKQPFVTAQLFWKQWSGTRKFRTEAWTDRHDALDNTNLIKASLKNLDLEPIGELHGMEIAQDVESLDEYGGMYTSRDYVRADIAFLVRYLIPNVLPEACNQMYHEAQLVERPITRVLICTGNGNVDGANGWTSQFPVAQAIAFLFRNSWLYYYLSMQMERGIQLPLLTCEAVHWNQQPQDLFLNPVFQGRVSLDSSQSLNLDAVRSRMVSRYTSVAALQERPTWSPNYYVYKMLPEEKQWQEIDDFETRYYLMEEKMMKTHKFEEQIYEKRGRNENNDQPSIPDYRQNNSSFQSPKKKRKTEAENLVENTERIKTQPRSFVKADQFPIAKTRP